jgi:hypothetical protein
LRASISNQLVTVPRSLVSPDTLNAYLTGNLTGNLITALPLRQAHPPPALAVAAFSSALHPSSSFSSASSASSATASGALLIPLTAGGWPVQPYDPNVATVEDVWKEWHVGLGAGTAKRNSILVLEAKFGSAWHYEQRMKQWHSRRKKMIRMIEQRVEQGHTLQDVFAQLNATGKSLDRLRKDMEKGIDLFSTNVC